MTELRPEVQRFAEEMEKQLRANKDEWEKYTGDFFSLMRELKETYYDLLALTPWDKEIILRRAANIANFAMMIADNWGGLMGGDKNA